MRHILFVIIAILCFSSNTQAEELTSIQKLENKAEKGSMVHQYLLGMVYQENKNYVEAAKWYRKAAEQGDALAQEHLNAIYEDETKSINTDSEITASDIGKGIGALLLFSMALDDSSSTNNSYPVSSEGKSTEYVRCYNQAIKRISTCEVYNAMDCDMIGCSDNTVKCKKNNYSQRCGTNSGADYYYNAYGLGSFYCDTEDSSNHGREADTVIKILGLTDYELPSPSYKSRFIEMI